MVIYYVWKAAVAEVWTQRAVTGEQQDAQIKITKSEESLWDLSKPRNQEKEMVVAAPPLHYLPFDSQNTLRADYQVTKPVDVTIELYMILFADRPTTPTK